MFCLNSANFKRFALLSAVFLLPSVSVFAQSGGAAAGDIKEVCHAQIVGAVTQCASDPKLQQEYRVYFMSNLKNDPSLMRDREKQLQLKKQFFDKKFVECGNQGAGRECAKYTEGGLFTKSMVQKVADGAVGLITFMDTGKPYDIVISSSAMAKIQEKAVDWNKVEKALRAYKEYENSGSTIPVSVDRLLRNAGVTEADEKWPYVMILNNRMAERDSSFAPKGGRGQGHGGSKPGYGGNNSASPGGSLSSSDIISGIAGAGERAAESAGMPKQEAQTNFFEGAQSGKGAAGQLFAGAFGGTKADEALNSPIRVDGAYSSGGPSYSAGTASPKANSRSSAGVDFDEPQQYSSANSPFTVTPQQKQAAADLVEANKYLKMGAPSRALAYANKAIQGSPNSPGGYLARARALLRSGDDPQTVLADADMLLKMAGIDPKNAILRAQANYLKAQYYRKAGDKTAAKAAVLEAVKNFEDAWKMEKDPARKDFLKEQLLQLRDEFQEELVGYEFYAGLDIAPVEPKINAEALNLQPAAKPASKPVPWLLYGGIGGLILIVGLAIVFIKRGRKSDLVRDPSVPDEMQNYSIVKKLGEGGMGEVFLAEDRTLGRKVAIKKVRTEIGMSEEAKEQLLNEARTVASLHHPNIVDIYTVFKEKGDLYLVFEYIDGETLDSRLDRAGKMSLAEAKPLFENICKALAYAHENGVIHRDLKLSNIMLGSNGAVKVMDFGVARKMNTKAAATISGTPAYMAPEQRKGIMRPESDIYSLGICLYEVITGHVPWELDGVQPDSDYIVAPTQIDSTLPKAVDGLLEMALCEDYKERIGTATEFWEILKVV